MTGSPDELSKQAFDHAWNWFCVHAAQRMQSFNYFLISAAFLIAAYGSLLDKFHWAALIVGAVGAWISFWFVRLDNRTLQLIEAGRNALKPFQSRLAKETNIPALAIIENVSTNIDGASSYTTVIHTIEWTMVGVFLAAAAYAGYMLLFVAG